MARGQVRHVHPLGAYSVPAGRWHGEPVPRLGEWIMRMAKIPVAEYEWLAPQFNPVEFDADEWVRVAKAAGMKYIVITAKHHDGFAMYASKASQYNIVDATPFHRDPMKELADACKRHGLRLCFYYSQAARTGMSPTRPETCGTSRRKTDKKGPKEGFDRTWSGRRCRKLRELLTGYGPIGLIWFDKPFRITEEQSRQFVDLVRRACSRTAW